MDLAAIFTAALAFFSGTAPIAFALLKIVSKREDAKIAKERIMADALIETEKVKAAALVDAAKLDAQAKVAAAKLEAEARVTATANEVEAARYRMEASRLEEERRARVDENTSALIERLLTALVNTTHLRIDPPQTAQTVGAVN